MHKNQSSQPSPFPLLLAGVAIACVDAVSLIIMLVVFALSVWAADISSGPDIPVAYILHAVSIGWGAFIGWMILNESKIQNAKIIAIATGIVGHFAMSLALTEIAIATRPLDPQPIHYALVLLIGSYCNCIVGPLLYLLLKKLRNPKKSQAPRK